MSRLLYDTLRPATFHRRVRDAQCMDFGKPLNRCRMGLQARLLIQKSGFSFRPNGPALGAYWIESFSPNGTTLILGVAVFHGMDCEFVVKCDAVGAWDRTVPLGLDGSL